MLISGSYDADIIRKSCNWIHKQKDKFGDSILEIGCDCGLMTCFLGLLFPNKKIISIDSSCKGIEIAQINAQKLGVKNVEFICTQLKDLDQYEKFDTVFSMRTMQENSDYSNFNAACEVLSIQTNAYSRAIKDYANTIDRFVKPNGNIISIERCHIDPLYLGWLQSINDLNYYFLQDSYEEIIADELEVKSHFQANVFQKGDRYDSNDIYEFWISLLNIDMNAEPIVGYAADVILEVYMDEYINGYFYKSKNNGKYLAKQGLYTVKENPNLILHYNYRPDGYKFLEFYNVSVKDSLLKQINDNKEFYKSYDFIPVPYTVKNGKEIKLDS